MSNGYYLYQFNDHVDSSCKYLFEKFGLPKTVIEVGVYQGYFSINMTHTIAPTYPSYQHYAIDPFTSSPDLDSDMIAQAYECFIHNLSISPYKNNIEFIRKPSYNGLQELINRGVKADLIYIDGDHTAPTVLQDLVLSYQLIEEGGVILCDDSVTWGKKYSLQDTPRLAIDSFIQCYWGKIEVLILPNSYQTAFIKR
jgi:predicted O-methyltransferase YrrM